MDIIPGPYVMHGNTNEWSTVWSHHLSKRGCADASRDVTLLCSVGARTDKLSNDIFELYESGYRS